MLTEKMSQRHITALQSHSGPSSTWDWLEVVNVLLSLLEQLNKLLNS